MAASAELTSHLAAAGKAKENDAIASSALLQGRARVTIDHEGIAYILSATRAGKLILTK
jgi:hemin uptake protein HemP